jgi:hypothetical protein
MSEKYRLMIYFAHSTMVMYSKTIETREDMTVGEFMKVNKDVTKRVFDEALSVFNYELSHEQMSRACYVYLHSIYKAQSVYDTEVFEPSKN